MIDLKQSLSHHVTFDKRTHCESTCTFEVEIKQIQVDCLRHEADLLFVLLIFPPLKLLRDVCLLN